MKEDTRPVMVSIKCLVYNHEPYLRKCLDGFVMQKTKFRFEAIVHDDASTDRSAAIIREYAEKYPDIIKPIYETENQYSKPDGIANAVNPHLTGKYICLCEGDDFWTDPLKLQKQFDAMEANPEVGLCYTEFSIYDQVSGKTTTDVFKNQPEKFKRTFERPEEYVINQPYMCPPSWMMRYENYHRSVETMKGADMTFIMFAYSLIKSKILYIPDNTATYRILPESASHSSNILKILARAESIIQTKLNIIEYYKLDKSYVDKCKQLCYKKCLSLYLRAGNDDKVNEISSNLRDKDLKSWILILLWRCGFRKKFFEFLHKKSH